MLTPQMTLLSLARPLVEKLALTRPMAQSSPLVKLTMTSRNKTNLTRGGGGGGGAAAWTQERPLIRISTPTDVVDSVKRVENVIKSAIQPNVDTTRALQAELETLNAHQLANY